MKKSFLRRSAWPRGKGNRLCSRGSRVRSLPPILDSMIQRFKSSNHSKPVSNHQIIKSDHSLRPKDLSLGRIFGGFEGAAPSSHQISLQNFDSIISAFYRRFWAFPSELRFPEQFGSFSPKTSGIAFFRRAASIAAFSAPHEPWKKSRSRF